MPEVADEISSGDGTQLQRDVLRIINDAGLRVTGGPSSPALASSPSPARGSPPSFCGASSAAWACRVDRPKGCACV